MYLQIHLIMIPIIGKINSDYFLAKSHYINVCSLCMVKSFRLCHILAAESVLGTCIAYLANSDTIKNDGIGMIPIRIPGLVQPCYVPIMMID